MDPKPRRALPPEEDPNQQEPRPLGRIVLAGTLASAVLLGGAYLVWGPRQSGPPPIVPSNSPVATASTPASRSAPATTSEAPLPSAEPIPSDDAPTAPVTDPATESENPVPTATPGEIELNDTSFVPALDWGVYGDDLIEGDRRMVRLSHSGTDARLQAVTLTATDPDLTASCRALVTTQSEQFDMVEEGLALPMGLDSDLGEGVTCAFSGLRATDQVPNTVTFTLVRRHVDGHLLMLRHTVPDAVDAGDVSRQQLASMSCQASIGFGVPLPLC